MKKSNKPAGIIQLKRVFPVKIGIIKTSDEYFRAIQQVNVRNMADKLTMEVTSKAEDLIWEADSLQLRTTGPSALRNFLSGTEENVLLADVSVEELGLPDNALYKDIMFKASGHSVRWEEKTYMLAKCLPEDLMMLRLKHLNQPKNEWLRAGMDGVEHPMGNKMIFRLVCGKNSILYLDTDDGGDDDDPFDDHVRFLWRLMPYAVIVGLKSRPAPKRKG